MVVQVSGAQTVKSGGHPYAGRLIGFMTSSAVFFNLLTSRITLGYVRPTVR